MSANETRALRHVSGAVQTRLGAFGGADTLKSVQDDDGAAAVGHMTPQTVTLAQCESLCSCVLTSEVNHVKHILMIMCV